MSEDRKLFEALKVIKETCSRRVNCRDCPLVHQDGECGVQDVAPEEWALNEPPPLEYRVFKK